MTWLAHKLDKRIDICKPVQTPDIDGGFKTTYEILVTIWAGLKTVSQSPFMTYIRGMQTTEAVTHIFTIRECAVKSLLGRNRENTINPLKSNYFIFLREGNEDSSSQGRRFAIRQVIEEKDFYKVTAEELFEEGSNY